MRLSRSLLVLAAGLAAPLAATNVTVDADRTINSLSELTGNNLAIGNGAILTIDLRNTLGAPVDGTFNGVFQDGAYVNGSITPGLDQTGVLLKTGGGTLQYNGFASMTYLANHSFDAALNTPTPNDLRPLQGNAVVDAGANQAFAGLIIVQQGQLQVSGFINQWAGYGGYAAAFGVGGEMMGAVATVVESGAKLSFRNTAPNLVGASAVLSDTPHNNPSTPLVARLNYLNNPLATTASRVETGPDTNYILIIHSDVAALGLEETTLGILEGRGRVYKTGASDLRITNSSTFDGEFVSAGGRVILAAGSGDTLWSAKSVNLASGAQGTNVAFAQDPTIGHWKPQYAPDGQQTTLVVQGAQRIRNFQSLYGDTGFTSMVNPGTGGGNLVEVALATDVLTIQQEADYDGYFTGSFVGAADALTGVRGQALGIVRKTGAGALALFSVGNNMSRIEVLDGRLISNVQSLGSGDVLIGASGALSIVQNDAGALRAVIRTAVTDTNAELRFKPTDSIQYRGGSSTALGNADAGVADIVVAQTDFYGKVIVEDGNAIVFSAGNNNAFLHASAIILAEGATGRETSIRFNDTNQIVNNLQGDASTRIYLGRGDITLTTTATATTPGDYAGTISGVGNLIKKGTRSFALAGANNYFGATVVSEGALAGTVTGAIGNTSGLVTRAGTAFTGTGAQSVGGLFGQTGSTVTIAGALTVGVSDELRARLVTELASLPGTVPAASAAYYLATDTAAVLPGFTFTPATTLGFMVRQYELAADANLDGVISEAEVAAYLDADGSGSTTLADLSATDIAAHADLLAFSGTLSVGGALTKVGAERLSLRGTVNFTGTDRRVIINQGTLEAALGTLSGASGITLGADGAYQALVTTNSTLTTPLSGTGTFIKTGAGRLDLDSSASSFTGTYRVLEGILAVTFSPSTPGGSSTNQGDVDLAAGSTFIAKVATNLSWGGEVYGTGTFIKTGAGVLTLTTGTIFHDGLTDVQQGGLVVSAITAGDLNLAAGTTFVDNVADDPLSATEDYFDNALTGTGTFTKTGAGDLRIENAQAFAGKLVVDAGSLTLVSANAFAAASQVELRDGATLVLLNGVAQSLSNISATAGATITVANAGTDLTLNVPSGPTLTFLGRILGDPDLIKTGAGKLYLDRPAASPNALATIAIQAGELEASQAGIGGADIDIAAGATLRFFADTGATDAYAGLVITGTGAIAKSGAGSVDLSGSTLTDVSTAITVDAGTLIVSETALGAGRAPLVTLAGGSTFEYQATNSVAFGVANFAGTGAVTFGRTGVATPTITLVPNAGGTTGYTGLTTVRDGVTLVLGAGFTSLGGINTEAGSTLDLSAIPALTINQAVDGTFAGNLVGTANLTLAGAAKLTVVANGGTLDGYAGAITVSGATLALDLANTKAVTLASGGTLSLRGAGSNYTGAIGGTGIVVLESGTAVDLTAPGAAAATTLGSAAVARIDLAPGSHLTASFTAGQPLVGKSIRLDGGLLTATGTGSITLALAAAATTPGTPTGPAGLELLGNATYGISGSLVGDLSVGAAVTAAYTGSSITGDVTLSGALTLGVSGSPIAITGDLAVSAGATLSGAWTLSGLLANSGTVAPGFSPAHVTVAGIDNSGLLQMEVTTTTEDQIAFTDSAILNRNGTGRLEVNRYGSGHSYGVRHVLFKDTVSAGAGSYVSAAAEDPRFSTVRSLGTASTAVRHLLVYPTQLQGGADGILGNADDAQDPLRSLAVDGEIAAYEVRAAAEYDSFAAPTEVIDWLKTITEVVMTETSPGEWSSTLGAGFTALGARIATLSDSQFAHAIDNLRANGQFSLATVAVSGARADQDAVSRRLEQRRFDKAGTSVKNDEWYVDAVGGRATVDNGPAASLAGATAGFIRDVGFDGYFGASLGVDKSKGTNALASVNTTGFRLGVFGGVLTDDRTVALDAGLSFASLSGDIARPSVFGTSNDASAKAITTSGWLRASSAIGLDDGWSLTPFAQFEASSTQLSGLTETGQPDRLIVNDATLSESSLSVGFGIQNSWTEGRGGWRYRLSLDIAYFSQLSGDTLSLTSGVKGMIDDGFAPYATESRVLPGSGLMLAPTFTFGPDPDATYTIGLRFDQASEGNAVTGQIGYRKRF